MYIVYFSAATGKEECIYATGLHGINKILSSKKFMEIDRMEFRSIDVGNPIYMKDKYANSISIHLLDARDVFMSMYRDLSDDDIGLSADDRHEIFGGIMLGNSDFDAEEINEVLADYGVGDIQAVDITEDYPAFCARLDNLREMSKEYHDKGDLKH